MRIVSISIIIGFVVFCGWLVAESGVDFCSFDFAQDKFCGNDKRAAGESCILLQQTVVDGEYSASNIAAEENIQREKDGGASPTLQAADSITFGADDAPARSVTLGSIDPKSGFKFQLELSSKGAAIRKATFSEFDNRDYKDPQLLEILLPVHRADGSEILSMANREFVFVEQGLLLRLNELHWRSYGVETDYDGSQTARFEAIIKTLAGEPVVKLRKTYKVAVDSYHLDCNVTVENLTGSEQKVRFNLAGPIGIGREAVRGDMRKVVGGFTNSTGEIVSSQKVIQTSFLGRRMGLKDATLEYHRAQDRQGREEAKKHLRITHERGGIWFLWAAVTNKYFAAILRPVPDEGRDYCDWVKDKTGRYYNPDRDQRGNTGDETVGLDLEIASSELAAMGQTGNTKTYDFQLYLGPKDKRLFDKNEQYQNLGFVQTIDFRGCCCPTSIISPLAFGILAVMEWMYGFVGNYGVVIIILVLLFRFAMHPVTKKSQVSMSKMSKLAPRAEQIKKKYADNKSELNKQLMALYKEQGASPIMGFLPIMVQMPIWIALWSAIYMSIALRGAPFLPFWITDLSAPDALVRFSTVTVPLLGWKIGSLNLLPILMGVAFYLQQKLMPSQAAASTNPQAAQQQKMMMIMMPVLFPLMLYNSPSGVNLYIMASTFAGVIEQHVIRKHIREKEEQESQGLVAATSKTGGKIKKKKPKPFYRNF